MIVTGFKKCCTSYEMNGREDEKEVEDVRQDENCADTEADTSDRNGEQRETAKAK
jgi:hypothetical protein